MSASVFLPEEYGPRRNGDTAGGGAASRGASPRKRAMSASVFLPEEYGPHRMGSTVALIAAARSASWPLPGAATCTLHPRSAMAGIRSEEHTSELQSPCNLL